ncbi:MBL fold metallo-hydrolase [Ferrovum sp.]|jgi:L-ascorbate metabolism protein UlaG (beta-lactamase superfamily)|uniref:MBL fold metallo-hydrolase n=1 Tax=Ferrovum sp. TaxID=2609467 RepID=UPI002618851A|nr:MBL fold metallo-hydrolase [Ferrovum sp.]
MPKLPHLIRMGLCGLGLVLIPLFAHPDELAIVNDTPSRPALKTGLEYQNRYPMPAPRSGFFQWLLTHWWRELDHASDHPPQPVPVNLQALAHPGLAPQVTWIGHSTLLLQMDGLNILFDPIFSDYASPLPPLGPRRYQLPGISLVDLPHIDVVMVSHNHYDHLDLPSMRALARQRGGPPRFLLPLGNRTWFLDNVPIPGADPGSRVLELNWDQHVTLPGRQGPVEFHFDAVQHWATRSLFDKDESLWGSWAVLFPHFRFWFSGDLGHSEDTRDIGIKYGYFDLAAISIGAYQPHWYLRPFHVDPAEAVKVFSDVHAQRAIGIHWGTFPLSDENPDQPPQDLDKALQQANIPRADFTVLSLGQVMTYSLPQLSLTTPRTP